MQKINKIDRLEYLAEQFDIFDATNDLVVKNKKLSLTELGNIVVDVVGDDKLLGLISSKLNDKNRLIKRISVSSDVFAKIIMADPTETKIYIQWMLTIFVRLLKSNDENSIKAAIRFVTEDLPQANNYLTLFESNKRKQKFKELCDSSYGLREIKDPTNINQYKSLSQLFDAVDPFIEREPSMIERTMLKYVDSGKAYIPVKDRKFTLYIPKTVGASTIFEKFANWCTAKEGNGMFKRYTTQYRKPNGGESELFIIINNDFFSNKSNEIYQIHFETDQIRDRRNANNVSIFKDVIHESEAISNFFHEKLLSMAKDKGQYGGVNIYLNYLIKFGFTESLFEMFETELPMIRIIDMEVPKTPDLSRFKNLDMFIMVNTKLVELHPSIGDLENLEVLSLSYNNIKKLPSEIGRLKKLLILNIIGNKNIEIPEEIKYLDKTNGGSLYQLCVQESDIGKKNYIRLKELLPNVII